MRLLHAAQRRVAQELAVELEPAELLGDPGHRALDGVLAHAERSHDLLERLAVPRELDLETREEVAQLAAAARARGPAGELPREGRSRQVVVEVDREVLRRAVAHGHVLPAIGWAQAWAPRSTSAPGGQIADTARFPSPHGW